MYADNLRLPRIGGGLLALVTIFLSAAAIEQEPTRESDRRVAHPSIEPTTNTTDHHFPPYQGGIEGGRGRATPNRAALRFDHIPQHQYPHAPPVVVDYRDDVGTRGRREGKWTGPIPSPSALRGDQFVISSNVAGGGCTFHIECDDGDACSMDTCDIAPGLPAGSGSCAHTPVADGQPGDCDDGVFCNGAETCMGGTCLTPGDPCTPGQVCSEDFDNCQSGPCAMDTDCTDNTTCTTESCVAGVCHSGPPTCGLNADCVPTFCRCQPACKPPEFCCNQPCQTDADCNNLPNSCMTPAMPACFYGRCCDGLTCTKKLKSQCAFDWYAGDTGRVTLSGAPCPPCPRYEAGIGDDPITAVVGPASLSPVPNTMSETPIRKIGDDYDFCASTPQEYLSLSDLRFVGGVSDVNNSRTAFEFYDMNGNFIEDFYYITQVNELAVRRVEFLSPLVIPCRGFIVAHVLQTFAQDVNARGEFFWAATDGTLNAGDSVDEGMNDKGTLYLETDLDWSSASPPQPVPNFIKVCSGGVDAGTPCGANADCESGACQSRSTDVLAFELVGTPTTAPNGACCKEGVGNNCDEEPDWICEAGNGTFLGLQTKCASCAAGSNNGGACRSCTAGDNAGLPCLAQSDCPKGACDLDNSLCPDGGTCVANSTCSTGACCITASGACETGHTPTSCTTAEGEFQGLGTDCDPNCCEQPSSSGADNCEEVIAHPALVPCQSDFDCSSGAGHCDLPSGACTITITGNNSLATNTPNNPDSCFPLPSESGDELGWFEALETFDCTFVRLDFCCTNPVKIPAYRIIYDSCPCGGPIFTKRESYEPEEPPDGRGSPYCDEDNAWLKFGPLPAGTYYYPILSFLGGQFDQYQLHFTVKPCIDAACCYNACSNSSNVTGCNVSNDTGCPAGEDCVVDSTGGGTVCRKLCEVNAECGAGESCDPNCGLMNQLECADIQGAFLAPPNRSATTVFCGGPCDTGSCCTAPEECEDEVSGAPMTDAECDSLGGEYVGGFRCYGGSCVGGSNAGDSCSYNSQCNSGNCGGSDMDLAQPSPCPICEVMGENNCQLFDDSVFTRASDLTVPGGTRAADDFRPAGTTINAVCVWGSYLIGDEHGDRMDCGDDVSDNFSVVVYNSDSVGLPGTVVGMATSTGSNVAKNVQNISAYEDLYQVRIFAYQLTLDGAITGLDPSGDTTYWLEVRNDTNAPSGNDCVWNWSNVDTSRYNDYSASGSGSGYGPAASRFGDMAFCLDMNFQAADDVTRACCDCDEVCTLETRRDCHNNEASWDVTTPVCAGCPDLPPANDNCPDVVTGPPVPDGIYLWNNHCSSTDGPNPTPTELNPGGESLTTDVWYEYVATCDGIAVFTTCATGPSDGGGVDIFIAAYRDPDNPTVCSCPSQANHLERLFPNGIGYDENCTGFIVGGAAYIEGFVQEGDCFLVRVGGFGGQGGEQGQGSLEIACSSADYGPPSVGDNTCQTAGADLGTPCNTNGDCTAAGSACASKSRYLSITPFNVAFTGGMAIKVEILSMPQFPSMVGDIYYAGVEQSIPNSPGTPLRGAPLQCTTTPNFQIWTSGVLHLWGSAIIPGSTYAVSMCDSFGNCSVIPLVVATGKWGDVVRPFGGASQPNFADINSIVQKFSNIASAPITPRVDLVGHGNPGTPNTPNQSANFADISADVSAFSGSGYPYTVPACP